VLDGIIGKLSYPVYITHFFIIKLFSNIPLFSNESIMKTILIILVTLLISYIGVKAVDDPIDRIRQRRVKNY